MNNNKKLDTAAYAFSDWALNADEFQSGISTKEAQQVTKNIWKQLGKGKAPKVVFPEVLEEAGCMGAYMAAIHEIGIKDFDGYTPLTVLLHELAHALTNDDSKDDHRLEWAKCFIELLRDVALLPGRENSRNFERKAANYLRSIV